MLGENIMMENYELADMIFRNLSDGYDDEEHRAETRMENYLKHSGK